MGQSPIVANNEILIEGAIWGMRKGEVRACGYGFKGVTNIHQRRDLPKRDSNYTRSPMQTVNSRKTPNVFTSQQDLIRGVDNLEKESHQYITISPSKDLMESRHRQLEDSEVGLPRFHTQQTATQTLYQNGNKFKKPGSTADSKMGFAYQIQPPSGGYPRASESHTRFGSHQQIPHQSSTSLDQRNQHIQANLPIQHQQNVPQLVVPSQQHGQSYPNQFGPGAPASHPNIPISYAPSPNYSQPNQYSNNQHYFQGPQAPYQQQHRAHPSSQHIPATPQIQAPGESRYRPISSKVQQRSTDTNSYPQPFPHKDHLAISPSATHPHEMFPHQHPPPPRPPHQPVEPYRPPAEFQFKEQQQNPARQRKLQLESKFLEILTYYNEHNVDFAYAKSQAFLREFGQQFQNHPSYNDRLAFIQEVETQYRDVVRFADQITKNKWEFKSQDKGIKISSCNKDGVLLLIQSEVKDVPVYEMISVVTQVDLHSKFVPYLTYSKQDKTVGRNIKIGHYVIEMPIISNRQVFFQGAGFDRLNTNGTIFCYTRSINNRPDLLKKFDYKPQLKKGSVILEYDYICLQCTPIDSHRAYVRLCLNVDLKLGFAPTFLVEGAIKKFGVEFYTNLLKKCKNFKGSQWEKAAQRKPQLYNFFKKTINQYFAKKGIVGR